jgi:hypothetical protein
MKNIFTALAIMIVLMASCSRDKMIEGPLLSDLYGEFKITEDLDISNRDVDFAAGESTAFTAKFSAIADWQLTITGLTSGAKKIITGKSRDLTVDNASWDGSTSLFPMFGAEDCAVELSIPADTIFQYDTLTVLTPKVHEGFVVADFENGFDPDWLKFVQSGANMSFVIKTDANAPQGHSYYDMGGMVDWDWLIGMIEFPAVAYDAVTYPLNSNPDILYFNVLLYLPEGISNEVVLFQFREDENADGTFTDSNEDMYSLQINDLDPGWQLISIKYSDLQCLVNGSPTEPNGNGMKNPDKLNKLSVLMLANPNSGYSQVWMDYIIFTENTPLIP